MNKLKYLMVITPRQNGEAMSRLLCECGDFKSFEVFCNGTASQTTLDFLGIERTEQTMLCAMMSTDRAKAALRDLVRKMDIHMPGRGIALTVPVESVGGSSALECLTGNKTVESGDEAMQEFKYSLIVCITDKGCTDTVMEAARSVGARGGTMIHAKGTGSPDKARFFGVTIAAEREFVYIVTKRTERDTIMKAIMEKAGMHTECHTAVFSLPVDSVVGLRSLSGDDEDQN